MKIFTTIILLSIVTTISAEQKTKLEEKFENIKILGTQFFEAPLPEVLVELQRLSKQFDLTEANPLEKGVQFVYKSLGSDTPPKITISLSSMSLKNSISMICEMVGWHYHLAENRIIISKFPHNIGENPLRTEFYELKQVSINKMIGGASPMQDPFAPPKTKPNTSAAKLKEFIQQNGIIFDTSKGHKFAFDGFQLIVTHDRENLLKLENILREHDPDVTPQISVSSILMEAPVRSLAKFAKELKLTKSDTENFPFISTDIANKLIDLMQESGEIKILHNPSSMVLDGNQVNIKSGIEYHFTPANESTRNSSPANSSKSEQLQGSAKKSPRYIGLSLELTPRIKKYQIIEIDLSFQFTRLIEDKRSDKNEREPIFWSSNTDTSIQMNPGQSFISVGASSEKGLELISFLTAQIKK
jgi:hypothetical protein